MNNGYGPSNGLMAQQGMGNQQPGGIGNQQPQGLGAMQPQQMTPPGGGGSEGLGISPETLRLLQQLLDMQGGSGQPGMPPQGGFGGASAQPPPQMPRPGLPPMSAGLSGLFGGG